jgi:formylglycine-generating enzyme required for sulfatase activity
MKKITLLLLLCFAFMNMFSNNVNISNVTTPDNQHVQFTVTWENSWYTTTNYDAIWIFIKAQNCSGTTEWEHIPLSIVPADHSASGGYYVQPASSDGLGVFIRRNSDGFGNVSSNISLTFASPYTDFASMNWQVFGIEMVWIPQGSFQVGDGSTLNTAGSGSAYNFGTNNLISPYTVNNENAIIASAFQNDKGLIWCGSPNSDAIVARNLALSASFPKGYGGFYIMKYEISQSQYVSFLNDLSLSQQGNRTFAVPTDVPGTYAMTGGTTALNRNSIVIKTSATTTTPAIYDCDLNHDGTYGDGGDIACNFLSYADLFAYLDWTALRPMTEMEYEKACRGTIPPTIRQYAWGNITLTIAGSSALLNAGTSGEVSSITGVGLSAFGSAPGTGPLRCGFAATSLTTQTTAGATIYGVLDMSGNVWEQCMQVGWSYLVAGSCYTIYTYPSGGIIYTGSLGDGKIDVNGYADASNWGNSNHTILKGGSWNSSNTAAGLQKAQISDRSMIYNLASYPNNSRASDIGGRGVRKP